MADREEIKEIVANLANSKIKASDNAKVGVFVGLDEDAVTGLLEERFKDLESVMQSDIEAALNEMRRSISQNIFDMTLDMKELSRKFGDFDQGTDAENESYSDYLQMGWYNLCCGEFKAAAKDFRDAYRCNPQGHEAYFGQALANNKIRLLDIGKNAEDGKSFNKIPIYCERSGVAYGDRDFTRDPSYKKAIEYSQYCPAICHKYEDCAEKINEIVRAFRKYREEGRSYDCFICSKVTELDKNGKPIDGKSTEDCKWAKRLHKELKEKGLNPFFSECDIQGQAKIVGTQYEALILYALLHAKCMVVVCSDQAYFDNSIYMQNEYERFKGFLKGSDRSLDHICLVRRSDIVDLPGIEGRQAIIRKGSVKEDDLNAAVDYVSRRVWGDLARSVVTNAENVKIQQAKKKEEEKIKKAAAKAGEITRKEINRSKRKEATHKLKRAIRNFVKEYGAIIMLILTVIFAVGAIVFLCLGSRLYAILSLVASVLVLISSVICACLTDWEDLGAFTFLVCLFVVLITISVGCYQLFGVYGVRDVVIKDGVLKGYYANEEVFEVPDEVDEIGANAFSGLKENDRIECIILPDGVKKIGTAAFSGCRYLAEIHIGSGLKEIESIIFSDCAMLETIYYNGTIEEWEKIIKTEEDEASWFIPAWDAGLDSYTIVCTDGTIEK